MLGTKNEQTNKQRKKKKEKKTKKVKKSLVGTQSFFEISLFCHLVDVFLIAIISKKIN